jgi:hypothetical protein
MAERGETGLRFNGSINVASVAMRFTEESGCCSGTTGVLLLLLPPCGCDRSAGDAKWDPLLR